MKITIDTIKQQIILSPGETYSIDELQGFLHNHNLVDYKIYIVSQDIIGKIPEHISKDFNKHWGNLLKKVYGDSPVFTVPPIVPLYPPIITPPYQPIIPTPFYPTCGSGGYVVDSKTDDIKLDIPTDHTSRIHNLGLSSFHPINEDDDQDHNE